MDEQQKEQIRIIIREEIGDFLKSDFFDFRKRVKMGDGMNIETSAVNGSKIATSALQKIGFFGQTPRVQISAISAAPSMSGTYVQSEQVAQSDRITNLIAALKNIGISA